ncbi:hypothetical protein CHS0354_040001 [Potamilus streckersoni]|uniref:Glutamyl-tRNA(Gln) amidotransferase subunit B, mitochondrial n=1 Tax=Potamilus streckersoni TaxID=2493646 RepID=A0AAE0S060_9BIVA|nr:hypothetical protein CHS0354_040001 [Potamilus streckersoni]
MVYSNRISLRRLCRLSFLVSRHNRHYSNLSYNPREQEWRSVVGLEIHAQIQSESKLFSGASTKYAGSTNTQVSIFDAAIPGTLPVLNRHIVEAGIRTAAALGCKLSQMSKFDRKHYFYADLPAGYQITQQRHPLARNGKVKYLVYNTDNWNKYSWKTASIIQLQLEQDSGKSLHDADQNRSLIDLNRAGVGLMEIVTAPDFTDGEEASSFVRELVLMLRRLETCSGRMEEGALRVDANISVHRPGEPLGVRTEVKNLNSVKSVGRAIDYEIKRQIGELESGREIVNETRSFDAQSGQTIAMRDKEKLQDYRFMPEPNLLPVFLYDSKSVPMGVDPANVIITDHLLQGLPSSPSKSYERIHDDHKISIRNCVILVNEDGLLKIFDEIVERRDAKALINFLIADFLGVAHARDINLLQCPVPFRHIAEVFDMKTNRYISNDNVTQVLELMFDFPNKTPGEIVKEKELENIQDLEVLQAECEKTLLKHPNVVQRWKVGQQKEKKGRQDPMLKLVNTTMTALNNRANPLVLISIFEKLLSKK